MIWVQFSKQKCPWNECSAFDICQTFTTPFAFILKFLVYGTIHLGWSSSLPVDSDAGKYTLPIPKAIFAHNFVVLEFYCSTTLARWFFRTPLFHILKLPDLLVGFENEKKKNQLLKRAFAYCVCLCDILMYATNRSTKYAFNLCAWRVHSEQSRIVISITTLIYRQYSCVWK